MCFKLWKAGGSQAAYNTATLTSKRAVHQARSEAEKVTLQKIDPRSGNVYRLAKQMCRDNQAWKEHYECLLKVEFPWNPEDLSEEGPVEGPSKPISQRPSEKWHLAKQPDHQVLLLRC